MKKWVVYPTICVFLALFCLIFLTVGGDYGQIRIDLPMPEHAPGMHVSLSNIYCYWSELKDSPTLPCTTYRPHEHIEVVYKDQRVIHASVTTAPAVNSAGDYILAWGTPIWIKRNPYSIILAWKDRGVYLPGAKKFTPFAPVGGVWRRDSPYLFWSLQAWDGFRRK